MSVRWLQPEALTLLWGVAALAFVVAAGLRARRSSLRAFASRSMLREVVRGGSTSAAGLRAACALAALALACVSLARPAWGEKERQVTRTGRDVVFVVDVSRSMLARDLTPNRLERAKLSIRDAMRVIQGDRVGLVAFAGSASVRCPLTYDHGFFRLALDEISPRSVARGGTMIGDAIRVTMDTLFSDDTDARTRDIILITDGEDQGSFPIEAAQEAGARGVRIIAIGLGSEYGAPVPTDDPRTGQYMRAQGEVVTSRLVSDTLERVAAATPGGVYLEVGTGVLDLDEIYAQLIRSADQREFETAEALSAIERFQWFLLPALGLLVIELFVKGRRYA
ncbi:MAG: VWA domain-containing protein [Phycisphaeraceae bacterium]|nr:VWA domain-containing protein [Phycisphaeraceae bacterium]